MSEMTATASMPDPWAMSTRARASATASSSSRMKAPAPVLTSMTRASVPEAIFLDMMEPAISGMESTVSVTSRRA